MLVLKDRREWRMTARLAKLSFLLRVGTFSKLLQNPMTTLRPSTFQRVYFIVWELYPKKGWKKINIVNQGPQGLKQLLPLLCPSFVEWLCFLPGFYCPTWEVASQDSRASGDFHRKPGRKRLDGSPNCEQLGKTLTGLVLIWSWSMFLSTVTRRKLRRVSDLGS